MDLKDASKIHGHLCFGLAVGYRAAKIAMQKLRAKKARGEELIAVVENKSCAVDAIQLIAGCTLGRGNLYVQDYGKHVYTFARRPSGRAVRVALKYEPFSNIKDASERMKKIMKARAEDIFDVRKLKIKLPPVAKIVKSVKCSYCGEPVMKTKTKKVSGRLVCISCHEKL